MVGIGIIKQSQANTLDVVTIVKERIARMNQNLPQGMSLEDSYDSSVFIQGAIDEVFKTLGIAIALVITVIWCSWAVSAPCWSLRLRCRCR